MLTQRRNNFVKHAYWWQFRYFLYGLLSLACYSDGYIQEFYTLYQH